MSKPSMTPIFKAALSLAAPLLVVLMLSLSPVLADVTIGLQDDATGATSANISIPVNANPVNGLHSFDIVVQFDQAVLVATGASTTAATAGWGINSNTSNPGQILISLFSASPLSGGSKPVVNISFHVVGLAGATSTLHVPFAITDDDVNTILDDGLFTVVCPAAPAGVPSLGLPSHAQISWSSVSGATGYDVVRGQLGILRGTNGNYSVATTACLADDTPSTSLSDLATPSSGDALWYLVRPVNCGGPGTYDAGDMAQVGSRDPGIQAAPAHCP